LKTRTRIGQHYLETIISYTESFFLHQETELMEKLNNKRRLEGCRCRDDTRLKPRLRGANQLDLLAFPLKSRRKLGGWPRFLVSWPSLTRRPPDVQGLLG